MKQAKKFIKTCIHQLPYLNRITRELAAYKKECYVPPGHFYSPIISVQEVSKRKNQIVGSLPRHLPGIDMNEDSQLQFLRNMLPYYHELPFPAVCTDGKRYFYENKYFSYADAIFLFGMMRCFRPSKIIEVGSGFSSAAMLDINDIFFDNRINLTCIEPFPENRLSKLVRATDAHRLIPSFLQDVDLDNFRSLRENDILFIDSSHVVKTGSELNHLLFTVMPELASGVLIHFHDIVYPFEYPWKWIEERRSWNETYFLRAFLMHNHQYQIVAFNSYLQKFHREWLQLNMPLALNDGGGSLWLRKM